MAGGAADRRLRAEVRRADDLEKMVVQLEAYHEEMRGQNEQLLETQVALEHSLGRFTDLYDHAPAAYLTLDRNGVIVNANHAAMSLLNVQRSGAIGVPLLFFVSEGDRKRYLEQIRLARRQEPWPGAERQTLSAEMNIKSREGRIIPVLFSLRLAPAERGQGLTLRTILIDLTERKAAEAQLRRYQQQLAAMAVDSAMAAERERRRIAVEVHDTLSQSLVLAKMKLAALLKKATTACVREDVAADLADVTQLIEEVLGQTRTLTFELSPPILYELGFEPALEWLAERVSKRSPGLRVSVDAGRHVAKLSEQQAVLLFQLVRELLSNAVKHAGAKVVVIRPRYRDGLIRVTVSDDGTGFDPARVTAGVRSPLSSSSGDGAHGGFGLFSVRTRLEHLGGQLHIDSSPGGPTSVMLSLPVAGGGGLGQFKG